jgi:hypothetical protein
MSCVVSCTPASSPTCPHSQRQHTQHASPVGSWSLPGLGACVMHCWSQLGLLTPAQVSLSPGPPDGSRWVVGRTSVGCWPDIHLRLEGRLSDLLNLWSREGGVLLGLALPVLAWVLQSSTRAGLATGSPVSVKLLSCT